MLSLERPCGFNQLILLFNLLLLVVISLLELFKMTFTLWGLYLSACSNLKYYCLSCIFSVMLQYEKPQIIPSDIGSPVTCEIMREISDREGFEEVHKMGFQDEDLHFDLSLDLCFMECFL